MTTPTATTETSTHRCPAWHCPREIADEFLLCPLHWRLVPHAIQRAVYRAYDRGAGLGSPELLAAQAAAIRAVNAQLDRSDG